MKPHVGSQSPHESIPGDERLGRLALPAWRQLVQVDLSGKCGPTCQIVNGQGERGVVPRPIDRNRAEILFAVLLETVLIRLGWGTAATLIQPGGSEIVNRIPDATLFTVGP